MNIGLNPQEAWQPLPGSDWNMEAVRHLLRRTCWTALPNFTQSSYELGLSQTLERLYPAKPLGFEKPKPVEDLEEYSPEYARKLSKASPEQRRQLQREARERSQSAYVEMVIQWLQQAAKPEYSAFEKWMLFLEDVWVITSEKVRNTALIYKHQETIRENTVGTYPTMAKAISRSPAMVMFLDLQQSQKTAPNENFARELFELFVLGEGNYTEKDIKEAAKAFTGYRQKLGEFFFAPGQHDAGPKTVFGETGNFSGDDVIDLAFKQKASGTFLPKEMVRWYLSETPLPAEYTDALGDWWASTGYDMRALTQKFFSSRLFFSPEFRGNYIKSPVQFYLGLVQDLDLDVTPLQRYTVAPLRLMGQVIFNPINVRGWIGGRTWINAATLTARRQVVETLFAPFNENNLNADEQIDIAAARSRGTTNFTVSNERFQPLANLSPEDIVNRFVDYFLPVKVDGTYRQAIHDFIAGGDPTKRLNRVRNAAITLLQSPEYELC